MAVSRNVQVIIAALLLALVGALALSNGARASDGELNRAVLPITQKPFKGKAGLRTWKAHRRDARSATPQDAAVVDALEGPDPLGALAQLVDHVRAPASVRRRRGCRERRKHDDS